MNRGDLRRWFFALLVWAAAVYAGLGLYLYVFQARQLYFPQLPSHPVQATPADAGLNYEPLKLKTADGETLDAWYIPAPGARRTLLYMHGNGGNIGHRFDPIGVFHRLGLNVLIFDYRGYGASTGKPDEAGTYADALAAWTYLTQTRNVAPGEIVLFGESLGGAVAAWLAARQKPAALVIYASFTSVVDMAQRLYPYFPARLLVRYRYDTLGALASINCPVLIMHSPDDEIIPFSHGQALYAAASEPKRLLILSGGHNDALLASREVYARGVEEFLAGLP
jgi:fermentation-respiration switch protein FrsA (DUF1100 family)